MREETFKLDNSPAPLVINDFMVTCWNVFNFVSDLQHLYSPELLEKVTKAVWAIKLNRGPDMLPRHDYRVVVVSDKRFVDRGVYWRGVEVLKDERIEACWEEYAEKKGLDMNEMALGYKGNRRDKDDNFYQYTRLVGSTLKSTSHVLSKKVMKLTIGPVRFTVRSEMVPIQFSDHGRNSCTLLTETGPVLWMSLRTFGGRTLGIRVPVNGFRRDWLGRIRLYSIRK